MITSICNSNSQDELFLSPPINFFKTLSYDILKDLITFYFIFYSKYYSVGTYWFNTPFLIRM
jgi:hypothetical protein